MIKRNIDPSAPDNFLAKRCYEASNLWCFQGRKIKYNWMFHRWLEMHKLSDFHYRQTVEYKSMERFFNRIEHLKP